MWIQYCEAHETADWYTDEPNCEAWHEGYRADNCVRIALAAVTQRFDNTLQMQLTNEEREAIIEWMKT